MGNLIFLFHFHQFFVFFEKNCDFFFSPFFKIFWTSAQCLFTFQMLRFFDFFSFPPRTPPCARPPPRRNPSPQTTLPRTTPPRPLPARTPPPPDRPKFRAFFPLPPPFSLFFSLSGGSSRGILVVFLKAGTLKCARLEFSGCRVKPRRPKGHPPSGPHPSSPNPWGPNFF